MVKSTNVPTICCGQPMEKIIPGTVDASLEKHVPVFEKVNNVVNVKVGSVEHPSTSEHFIEWIALVTKQGNQRKVLKPGDSPKATFYVAEDDEVVDVYAYCNLHGLWKA